MAKFTDKTGQEWSVAITAAELRRVKQLLGIKLDQAVHDDTPANIEGDAALAVDVVYLLCKPQADERKIGDEDFGRLLDEDAFVKAKDALWEALAEFYPTGAPEREVIGSRVRLYRQIIAEGLERAVKVLRDLDPTAVVDAAERQLRLVGVRPGGAVPSIEDDQA